MKQSKTLVVFIEDIVQATKDGNVISSNLRVTGVGTGLRSRTATFHITTVGNAKVYPVAGLSQMVAQVVQFTKDEREIKEVSPITIAATSLRKATYSYYFLDEPVAAPPEATSEAPTETLEENPSVDTPEEEKPVGGATEAPTGTDELGLDIPVDHQHPLTEKSKKELVKMVKDRGLSGNSQMSKKKLIEALHKGVGK